MFSESVKNRLLPYLENLDPNHCINYKKLSKDGYGDIQETVMGKKKHNRAHRVAYSLYHNIELTSNQIIMHSCDNPSCVNPFHLSIGTHFLNVQDKVKKGRQAKGKQNGRYVHGYYSKYEKVKKEIEFQSVYNRVLSQEQVKEIKELIKSKTKKLKEIAKLYQIKETIIRDISCGRTYKNI